jgi:hypothetical protein
MQRLGCRRWGLFRTRSGMTSIPREARLPRDAVGAVSALLRHSSLAAYRSFNLTCHEISARRFSPKFPRGLVVGQPEETVCRRNPRSRAPSRSFKKRSRTVIYFQGAPKFFPKARRSYEDVFLACAPAPHANSEVALSRPPLRERKNSPLTCAQDHPCHQAPKARPGCPANPHRRPLDGLGLPFD